MKKYLFIVLLVGFWSCELKRTYDGEFKDGQYNGQGTLTYQNGAKYIGEFKGGVKHGKGIYRYDDDFEIKGQWVRGNFSIKPPNSSNQSNGNCTTSGARSFARKKMSINGKVMDIKLVESGYRQWEATGIVYTRLGQTYNYLLIRCFDGSFVIKDIEVRKL